MKERTIFSYLVIFSLLITIFYLENSCTPKHLNTSGDAKVYNDDSEITMNATERKTRMPFDTAAPAPAHRK